MTIIRGVKGARTGMVALEDLNDEQLAPQRGGDVVGGMLLEQSVHLGLGVCAALDESRRHRSEQRAAGRLALRAPVDAMLALHEAMADQVAAQRREVWMEQLEPLVDLLLGIVAAPFEPLGHPLEDDQPLLFLRGNRFELAVLEEVAQYLVLPGSIGKFAGKYGDALRGGERLFHATESRAV